MAPERGAAGEVTHVVCTTDTALEQGSGDVAVLATPRLLALCEAATVAAVGNSLADNETSVGMKIKLDHINPTQVGCEVRAEAHLIEIKGRQLTFTVSAHDDRGLIAVGKVTRIIVDRERFLDKVGS